MTEEDVEKTSEAGRFYSFYGVPVGDIPLWEGTYGYNPYHPLRLKRAEIDRELSGWRREFTGDKS